MIEESHIVHLHFEGSRGNVKNDRLCKKKKKAIEEGIIEHFIMNLAMLTIAKQSQLPFSPSDLYLISAL